MAPHPAPADDEPLSWQELAERIGAYLQSEGVPTAQARHLSQAVIRMCADAADSLERHRLHDDAMDEARTLLETWQASRREQILSAG